MKIIRVNFILFSLLLAMFLMAFRSEKKIKDFGGWKAYSVVIQGQAQEGDTYSSNAILENEEIIDSRMKLGILRTGRLIVPQSKKGCTVSVTSFNCLIISRHSAGSFMARDSVINNFMRDKFMQCKPGDYVVFADITGVCRETKEQVLFPPFVVSFYTDWDKK